MIRRDYATARQLEAALRRDARFRGRAVTIISHDEHCALFDPGPYEPRCDCAARRQHVRVVPHR